MARRLLSLGALVLVASGCGAETVSSGATRETVRIETVTRYSVGENGPHEFRSAATYDYGRDRSLYVDDTTGCRTITIADRTYSELPAGELAEGKRWLGHEAEAIDLEAQFEKSSQERTTTTSDGGIVVESSVMLFATEEPEPDGYLDYLREASDEIELVGEEEIRGVGTTHYRAEVDPRRSLRKELETDGWKPENIDRYLEHIGHDEEIVDVWIGDDGLARRVVRTTRDAFGAGSYESVTTSDYLDYGLDAAIEAPPADEVVGEAKWERTHRIEGPAPPDGESESESEPPPSCLH